MTVPESGRLLVLLQLCDSLFPLGSFAHSDGLETASSSGLVTTGSDLRSWLEATRDEVLARGDGPALRIAFDAFRRRAFAEVVSTDDELHAMRPAMAARQASRAMGTRLLKTWQEIRPNRELGDLMACRGDAIKPGGFTLPVAFGAIGAACAVPLSAVLEGYFYSRLAAAISAAMRLISIGQHEAHALLADALDGVPSAVAEAMAGGPPTSFVPALDLAGMSHQFVHSRLFRS